MRVGSLVALVGVGAIGIITKIGSPNPIATIHWSNGRIGAIHIDYLEVLCE